MDAGWIGVIGGAVGSLAGSVATQLLASKNATELKATDREALLQDRWFEEKRGVYMNVVETATKAHVAFINLKLMSPENRQQSREVDDLLLAFESILELLPRLSLVEAPGGGISATSPGEGRGATVTVRLPGHT